MHACHRIIRIFLTADLEDGRVTLLFTDEDTRRDDIVYKQLLDNIKAGVWKSGDKLPTENELSKELNVSRVTIRAALQRLRSIGLVESKHGKGTFVCPNEDLFDYTGFSDTINLTAKEYKEIVN